MFCPSCTSPNAPGTGRCAACGADLAGVRERVAVGTQFVFVDASSRRPVALALDDAEPQVWTGPAIVSRHRHGISLGDSYHPPHKPGIRPPRPGVQLPRLPAPAGPDLLTVITDRKIYRPREEARIFIVAPGAPGAAVEMEVQLARQTVYKDRIALDDAGAALRPYAGLEEGEYTILVRRAAPGPRDANRPPVDCTFSVAEFALAPLVAHLERHTYDAKTGRLAFGLRVMALSVPYAGPATLGLQSAAEFDLVVESKAVTVHSGLIEDSFDVAKYGGPFHLVVTAPDGAAATVFVPGTAKTERERIMLCPLGRVAEAGLLPGEETEEVRGLHVGYDGVENTPLRLESAVASTGRVVADLPGAAMQVVAFHPLTGEMTTYERAEVRPGDAIEFPVEAPYTLFTAALLAPRLPYEAWGVVVCPSGLGAALDAPETAAPGAEIAVRVASNAPAACLLLVYDARLEHESPVPKLGKQAYDAIRAATTPFKEQTAPSLASVPGGWGYPYPEGMVLRATMGPMPPPMPVAAAMTELTIDALARPPKIAAQGPGRKAAPTQGNLATDTAVEAPVFVAAPSREDFPELAYLELFPVRDRVERTVRLGDQIGVWRCRAYLVAGLDVQELTADVQAAKPVYAELDLPAIVGQGDDILAAVRYHTRGPATMTLTLPDGRSVSGAVMGHGIEKFHLTAPGELTVHIAAPEGDDWTTRKVDPPGVQTVTASRLEILRRGDSVEADRVMVYPGPADVLQATIEALGRYPFG